MLNEGFANKMIMNNKHQHAINYICVSNYLLHNNHDSQIRLNTVQANEKNPNPHRMKMIDSTL